MRKATVTIFRMFQDEKQTSGLCYILDENNFPLFSSLSLERGWQNNERNISCLPKGKYPLILEHSNRFKKELWEIKDTGNRSECKFHSASFWFNLNGCVSLGVKYKHLNKDTYFDLSYSSFAMDRFHNVLSNFDEVELNIEGLDWLN